MTTAKLTEAAVEKAQELVWAREREEWDALVAEGERIYPGERNPAVWHYAVLKQRCASLDVEIAYPDAASAAAYAATLFYDCVPPRSGELRHLLELASAHIRKGLEAGHIEQDIVLIYNELCHFFEEPETVKAWDGQ